jgi:hypothetical protein
LRVKKPTASQPDDVVDDDDQLDDFVLEQEDAASAPHAIAKRSYDEYVDDDDDDYSDYISGIVRRSSGGELLRHAALRVKRPAGGSARPASHALRIKRSRSGQILGSHTLRLKKGVTFNHVLRTKKDLPEYYAEEGDRVFPYMKRQLFRSHVLRTI